MASEPGATAAAAAMDHSVDEEDATTLGSSSDGKHSSESPTVQAPDDGDTRDADGKDGDDDTADAATDGAASDHKEDTADDANSQDEPTQTPQEVAAAAGASTPKDSAKESAETSAEASDDPVAGVARGITEEALAAVEAVDGAAQPSGDARSTTGAQGFGDESDDEDGSGAAAQDDTYHYEGDASDSTAAAADAAATAVGGGGLAEPGADASDLDRYTYYLSVLASSEANPEPAAHYVHELAVTLFDVVKARLQAATTQPPSGGGGASTEETQGDKGQAAQPAGAGGGAGGGAGAGAGAATEDTITDTDTDTATTTAVQVEETEFHKLLLDGDQLFNLVEALFRANMTAHVAVKAALAFRAVLRLGIMGIRADIPQLVELVHLLLGGTPVTPTPLMQQASFEQGARHYRINAQGIRAPTQTPYTAFYQIQGKAIACHIAGRLYQFWPDERLLALAQGCKHLGKRVKVEVAGAARGEMTVGKVVGYNPDTNLHSVALEGYDETVPMSLDSRMRRLVWLDTPVWVPDDTAALSYSADDVGKRVAVLWTDKYYEGLITDYDDTPNEYGLWGHQVVYDDATTKWYPPEVMKEQTLQIFRQYDDVVVDADADGLSRVPLEPLGARSTIPATSRFVAPLPGVPAKYMLRPTPVSYAASMYLVDAINYFGASGGFTAITTRAASSKPGPVSVASLRQFLRIMQVVQSNLLPSQFQTVIFSLQRSVFLRVQSLDDAELKSLTLNDLKGVFKTMQALWNRAAGSRRIKDVAIAVDKAKLDLAAQLLRCNQLDKRLAGLQDIRAAVETADRVRKYIREKRELSDAWWPKPKWMTDWLTENHLLEEIFGASMHMELVKRR